MARTARMIPLKWMRWVFISRDGLTRYLDIHHCYLQADPSNDMSNSLREFAKQQNISFYDLKQHTGALRNLIIRTSSTGELMVIVVFAYPSDEADQKRDGIYG